MTLPTVTIDLNLTELTEVIAERLMLMCVDLPIDEMDQQRWSEWIQKDQGNALYQLRQSCADLNRALALLEAWDSEYETPGSPHDVETTR